LEGSIADVKKHDGSSTSAVLPEATSPDDAPGVLTNHAAKVFNRHIDTMLRPYGLPMAHLTPLM